MAEETKNDKAWEALFAEHNIMRDIESTGTHSISAATIGVKREARLMTKLDHSIVRPKIFKENDLSILPDSRGTYVIGRFKCYESIPRQQNNDIIGWEFPDWMQSLLPSNLYSEDAALLCALHAGLIKDVLEQEVFLTVSGRMSTDDFDLLISKRLTATGPYSNWPVSVRKAQCEIDGGFEGPESFAVVEVKNQEIDDFHIRQLYYPYRLWASKLNKPVVPVFLTYTSEIFSFYVYEFADPNNYNSLQLVKQKRYQIEQTEIEVSDIRRLLAQTRIASEPRDVVFPQANEFERVIDLLTRLAAENGVLTQDEVTTNYAFDLRQTQYYTNAGKYLGLVERLQDSERGVYYSLTPLGMQLMKKSPRARNLALVEVMSSRRVFRGAIEYYLDNAQQPPDAIVVSLISIARPELTGTTPPRRAQTVRKWVSWVMSLTAEG